MKPKVFLLLLLFSPYLLWIMAIYFVGIPTKSIFNSVVAGVSVVYAFGIVFWGIPYTIFTLGMLIWSRNKSSKEIYTVLSHSPLWLALITVLELFVIYFYQAFSSQIHVSLLEDFFSLVGYSFMAMFGVFVYGYIFVFLGKKLYKAFEHFGMIKTKDDIQNFG